MNIKEFREAFASIPDSDIIVDRYTDGESKCCAVGHYQRLSSENPSDYSVDTCSDYLGSSIRLSSKTFLQSIGVFHPNHIPSIATVNNGKIGKYQQETSKERVLALLDDMIAANYM